MERLAELQAVDTRLADLRGRLAAIPRQLSEIDGQVSAARQKLTEAKEALTTSLKDRKTYEMDVQAWKDKANKYKAQSFEVKSNEAYKALQHEIQHAEQEALQAEDRLLERMVAGEEFERQVKAAEIAIKGVETSAGTQRREIEAAEVQLRKEFEAKEAERREKVSAIPESLFQTYERIAQRRHGIGLAEVRTETCSLCGMRIRPHVFQELQRPDCKEIFQCEVCTRILYYVEPPAPPSPEHNGNQNSAKIAASDQQDES